MCGRFSLTTTPEDLAEVFEIEVPELRPRYNIAPGQEIATVQRHEHAGRELRERRWGLSPSWARDPKIGFRMINARSETVAEKPAFQAAFRQRRCLIPASGFYEWTQTGKGSTAIRQAYHLTFLGESVFAMAGLYEEWTGSGGEIVESCALLTTRANDRIAFLHPRMPVILPRGTWQRWLEPGTREPRELLPLLVPAASEQTLLRPVSPRVNDARIDDAACLATFEADARSEQGALF